jgi:hypothetical protein
VLDLYETIVLCRDLALGWCDGKGGNDATSEREFAETITD